MKVLVTGGAGFIGSHIVDGLVSEGHETVILDDFSAGNHEFVNSAASVVEADIRDTEAVNRAFQEQQPEAVFHLAAMVDLRESLKNPEKSYAVNVIGSQNIIRAAKNVGVKKFIFSSSAAVYGNNNNLPIKESEPIAPTSPYGEQKAEIEKALKDSGVPSIVLRYANVYGPRQGTVGEGGVVAIFCKKLRAGEQLAVFGSGEQTRDFVFVDDVASANLKALAYTGAYAICNISTRIETSVNHIASALLSVSQKNTTISHTEALPEEVLRNSLDSSFAQKTLHWESVISIEEGLEATWKWFTENVKVKNSNAKSMPKF
ncbi:hypothetical protein BK004_04030 [bacterium CG10_46_32]|nr:MAG: hypothetical protein BK004_04030 [bacterium CG10_46_32]